MAIFRHAFGVPLALLFPFLPACALPFGSGHETRDTAWPTTVESPAKSPVPFALTRKPGVSIPLNPEKIEPAPVEPLPVVSEAPPSTTQKESTPGELPPSVIPPTPEAPLVGILRAYLDDRPEAAMPLLQTLDKPNREMVLQLVPALVKASKLNPAQADPKELAVVAGQFTAVANQLNKRAPMTIEKALFCRTIKNFGRYEALPEYPLLNPGTTNIIYFEIGNVASEPANQNGVEGNLTKLVCTWQLRDSADRPLILVGKERIETLEMVEPKMDFSRSQLRDYFLQLQFNAPAKPGQYTVHFKVKDSITGREVARSLPFRVP